MTGGGGFGWLITAFQSRRKSLVSVDVWVLFPIAGALTRRVDGPTWGSLSTTVGRRPRPRPLPIAAPGTAYPDIGATLWTTDGLLLLLLMPAVNVPGKQFDVFVNRPFLLAPSTLLQILSYSVKSGEEVRGMTGFPLDCLSFSISVLRRCRACGEAVDLSLRCPVYGIFCPCKPLIR